MELKAPRFWTDQFIAQNNLIKDSDDVALPSDVPAWFNPRKNFQVFRQKGFDEGSLYFEDTSSDRVLIYEIQL